MSFLKVVGKDGAIAPDKALIDALDAIRAQVVEGKITAILALVDGPSAREFYAAGEFDIDIFWGLSQQALLAMASEADE